MRTIPRKRWHGQHALDKVLSELKESAKQKMSKALEPQTFKDISVHIIRDCDLRATLQEKALSVHDLARWTCFVNRAGTLLHIVPREGDGHWRQPLYYTINNHGDKFVERVVQEIMHGRMT